MEKVFKDWTMFEKLWLGIFTLINIYLFFAWSDTVVGLLTSLTGMVCVVLTARGKISNYYFGIVNVILYAYLAYNQSYYGEVMLNLLYFLPFQFIGIYIWGKHKNENNVVKVKTMSNKLRLLLGVIATFGVIGYGLFLQYLNGSLPYVDSISTVFSVIAMVLMAKRYVEQWILWIIVDVVSIIMWLIVFLQNGNDVSILLMWSAYLVNAVYGFYNWNKLREV